MIAITGYTIFIDIAVTPPGNQVWSIMHGPLSVVFGILAGFLAAYLCAFTKLWNNKVKRTAVVLLAALFMKFIFDRYGFTSGGALGSLTLGLLVKELWARGQPGPFALKETNGEFIRSVRPSPLPSRAASRLHLSIACLSAAVADSLQAVTLEQCCNWAAFGFLFCSS